MFRVAESIPAYTYGNPEVAASPLSLDELQALKATVGFTTEDERFLQMAGEVLTGQTQQIVAHWRSGIIAGIPNLARHSRTPEGEPNPAYLAASNLRFAQWILDTCLRPYDQDWLDYQQEIALRHTSIKKNQADGVRSTPFVPFRDVVSFIAVMNQTIRPYLANRGHNEEEECHASRLDDRSRCRLPFGPNPIWTSRRQRTNGKARSLVMTTPTDVGNITPEEYDLVMIGSGQGSKYLAWTLARQGQRVAMIERKWIGGPCANIACLPSKNIIHSAKVAPYFKRAAEFGINTSGYTVDMAAVTDRKRKVVNGLMDIHIRNYETSGTELILGNGHFVGPKLLEVNMPDGTNVTSPVGRSPSAQEHMQPSTTFLVSPQPDLSRISKLLSLTHFPATFSSWAEATSASNSRRPCTDSAAEFQYSNARPRCCMEKIPT